VKENSRDSNRDLKMTEKIGNVKEKNYTRKCSVEEH